MEYPVLPESLWQTDLSEMFVLMGLIMTCLRRLRASVAVHAARPVPSIRQDHHVLLRSKRRTQTHPLAPVPVPTPRLTI